jgi:hypothetical protein
MEAFPITRSQRKLHESSSEILTPASETIISGNRHTQEQGVSTIVPVNDNGTIRWTNVPKQPIPSLDNVDMWIGHQLQYTRMPVKYQHMPPEGELITTIDGYPEGLLGIPNNDGSPRIIVPKSQRKAFAMSRRYTSSITRKSAVHPETTILLAWNDKVYRGYMHYLPDVHNSLSKAQAPKGKI